MTPSTFLDALNARGITVRPVAGRLEVSPASALTAADRTVLRTHRHALLVHLVNPPRDSGLCPNCHNSPSLCPPYGWCHGCTDEAWSTQGRDL